MPYYEYECPDDGSFEIYYGTLEEAEEHEMYADCPTCKCDSPRVISAPGVRFVGAGFYINDYKQGDK